MKRRIYTHCLLLISLLGFTEAIHAQDWQLVMEITVTNDGKKMDGATVELRKGGALVKTLKTDGRGDVDVPLDPDGDYVISITGNGLINKKIAVNTKGVPPEDLEGQYYFPAEVDIFPKLEGLDYKVLEQPIGKIGYIASDQSFDADIGYTRQRKAALDKLQSDYLDKKEKEAELAAQKQEQYDAAIKAADKAFNDEEWELAEQEYKRAAELKPIETYPSFQLAELETKLIKIREANKKYNEAIKLADQAAAEKDYQRAMVEYKRAASAKPDETYPQDKVKEMQGLLAQQVKNEQAYLAAIERGDNALKISDLNTAKSAFEEAAKVKPDETYPQNKLAEINDILGKREAKDQEYQAAVKAADDALTAKNYEEAKANYQKALAVKPTESYPQEQITKVEGLMAEAAKQQQEYLAAIEKADQALSANKLDEALTAYQSATAIKSEEEYPKNKIKEVEAIIAKNKEKAQAYQDQIAKADKALSAKSYEEAKSAYQAAAQLKPQETYPQTKIKEIDGILANKAKADADYQAAIKAADQALAAKNYAVAKEQYNAALAVKAEESYPKEKLAEIGTILVKIEENQAAYDEAVQNGDQAMAADDLEKAKEFFAEAKKLKPEETYPQGKLDEIAGIEKDRAAADQAYQDAIVSADAALKEQQLETALGDYQKAASLKPNETYPKEQITKVEAQIAAAAKEEAAYQAAIKKGDDALAAKELEAALSAYKEASTIRESESYPKEKQAEITALLAAAKEKDAQYDEAIAKADKAFEDGNFAEAKNTYESALQIKDQQYPKNQIKLADEKLAAIAAEKAAAEKLEADYQAALQKGKEQFEAEAFEEAITAYQNALSLKPDAAEPSKKIEEIEKVMAEVKAKEEEAARLAEQQKQYDEKIAEADQAFQNQDLKSARDSYQAALAIKSEEAYPKSKIEEINATLADAAEQDEKYQAAISQADELFSQEKWQEAKTKYNEAASIKSDEEYPKAQISLADEKLAAMAAAQEEIRLQQAKEAETEAAFEAAMKAADELAGAAEFKKAISKYEEALGIKDEQIAKDKIAEMQAKIAEAESRMAAEEAAKIDAEYQTAIVEADKLFASSAFAESIAQYEAALQIKDEQYPKDQIALAKQKQAELASQAEKEAVEKEYNALIAKADELFASESWSEASAKYEEALKVKEDAYPNDQIERIKEKQAALASAAKQAELEAKYNALISEADGLFDSEQFKEARAKYEEALQLKDEQHPKDQLATIKEKLSQLEAEAEKEEREARFQKLIAEADKLLEKENLKESKAKYEAALAIKEADYPKSQLETINGRLAELAQAKAAKAQQAELEANYQALIAEADQAFETKDYQNAKRKYEEAIGLKEGDPHPVNRLAEIETLTKQLTVDKKYDQAIAKGDEALESGDYNQAKDAYRSALAIKANETYPQEQIAKADQLIAEQAAKAEEIRLKQEKDAKKDAAYQAAISEADKLFSDKAYQAAIDKYKSAKAIRADKTYPLEQIDRIQQLLKSEALAAEKKEKEAKERERRYLEIISSGNASFKEKDYDMAIRQYEAALAMKPQETYPQNKIKEIQSILKGEEKESKPAPKEEPIAIQTGPKSTVDGNAEDEIDRMYAEMWAKKQANKGSSVDEKRELLKSMREDDKEREEARRSNAIERIEDISVSIRDQQQNTDELNLQNYETVKRNTEDHREKVQELTKESERRRNNNLVDNETRLEANAEFRKQKIEEGSSVRKADLEEREKRQKEFSQEHYEEQQTRIYAQGDQILQKEEAIRSYNSNKIEENRNKNTDDLQQRQLDYQEGVRENQKSQGQRTEKEYNKIEGQANELRTYNQERSDDYMEGYEEVKQDIKNKKEFESSKRSDADKRRMQEQSEIEGAADAQLNQKNEGNNRPNENYIEVVEKTEAVQSSRKQDQGEAEKRRQNASDKEYYEGEDKPRKDQEAANYPQGVTEKIIEHPNGSTTIRRIKVEGTEVDTYEKTLFAYGNITYTKNGKPITKENWDANSK